MKVKLGSFYLSNGDQESPNGLTIDEARTPQVAEGLRWRKVKVFDRANKRTTIAFSVTRLWPTVGAAESFMLKHGTLVPSNGLLQFTLSDNTTLYMPDTECATTSSKHIGATTMHSYSLVGGEIITGQQLRELS